MWRGLAVDVDCVLDFLEDVVEHLEPDIVVPAVDVYRLDVEVVLPESVDGELCDASLP